MFRHRYWELNLASCPMALPAAAAAKSAACRPPAASAARRRCRLFH